MSLANRYLILFSLFIYALLLQGCISLSSLKENTTNKQISKNIQRDQIRIQILKGRLDPCVTEDQKNLIQSFISSYFTVNDGDIVQVTMRETHPQNILISSANVVVSALTLTLVPLYMTSEFDIEINIWSKYDLLKYETKIVQRGLLSILVIPVLPFKSFFEDRRKNIDAAFAEASKLPIVQDYTRLPDDIKEARVCSTKQDLIENRLYW